MLRRKLGFLAHFVQRNGGVEATGHAEREEIPFDGRLRFAADGRLKLDVVELDAFHVLRFLHELRHLFLGYKLSSAEMFIHCDSCECFKLPSSL